MTNLILTVPARVAVSRVNLERDRRAWKETQESGQNSVQEALDLVHSVARMQPEAAAGEKQNEEMEEKKKTKETKETKKKKKAQEKPEGGEMVMPVATSHQTKHRYKNNVCL